MGWCLSFVFHLDSQEICHRGNLSQHSPDPSQLSGTGFNTEAEMLIPCEEHPAMPNKMGFHHPILGSSQGALSFRYHGLDLIL